MSDSTGGRVRKPRKLIIEPYMGYGTPSKLVLSGRVLEDKDPILSAAADSKWRNLRNTFRRLATNEVAGARVRATYRGISTTAASDPEGYFRIEIDLPEPVAAGPWEEVALELGESHQHTAAAAKGEALVPPASARFGVISDIDDTVVTTNVTSTFRMLSTVLLSNAHARMPFHGIAAFYRALQRGASGAEGNPMFYVSNGPWNFHGLLVEFFRLNRIPVGPLFLRDFGPRVLFSSDKPQASQKLLHIDRILETYGRLPFILIGDSGERDPEIYAETLRRHPERIRVIYIRSVDRRPERLAAIAALAETIRKTPTQFVVASDSTAAAVHAAGEGLIDARALPIIAGEAADES